MLQHTKSQILLLDSTADSYQLPCIYTATDVDTDQPTEDVPNRACISAPGSEYCGCFLTSPALNCSALQMTAINEYTGSIIRAVTNNNVYKKRGTERLFMNALVTSPPTKLHTPSLFPIFSTKWKTEKTPSGSIWTSLWRSGGTAFHSTSVNGGRAVTLLISEHSGI